jgi:hypothetical protein
MGISTKTLLTSTLLAGSLSVGLLSTGCKCNSEKKVEKPAPSEEPSEPKLPAAVDADLFGALKKAAAECKATPGQDRIDCNGGDKNAIVLSFNRNERDRVQSLPTFSYALSLQDPKLDALAASVLYASFRNDFGPSAKKKEVSPALAKELLAATLRLPSALAMQAMPAAAHAAMLSGQEKDLYQALSDDLSIQVKTMAYRYLMVYGRLAAFDKIQELGKSPAAAVVLAAIESPRNMSDWKPEDQAAICPWAEAFLNDARPAVAGNAAAVLSNCSGEQLDHLLTQIDRVIKEKQFTFVHATALRDICGKERAKRSSGATDKQCEKVRSLQEKVATDSAVPSRVRAMSLSTLAYTWADEKSLALAKKLEKDGEADVARAAEQIVTRLSPQLGRQKATH